MPVITEKNLRTRIRDSLVKEVRRSVLQEQAGVMGPSSEIIRLQEKYKAESEGARGSMADRNVIEVKEVGRLASIAFDIVQSNHNTQSSGIGDVLTKREVSHVRSHYEDLKSRFVATESRGNLPAVAIYELLFINKVQDAGWKLVDSTGRIAKISNVWDTSRGWGSGPAEILHNSIPPVVDLVSIIRDAIKFGVGSFLLTFIFGFFKGPIAKAGSVIVAGLAYLFGIKLILDVITQGLVASEATSLLRSLYEGDKVLILVRESGASLETGTSSYARKASASAVGRAVSSMILKKLKKESSDLAKAGEEKIRDALINETELTEEDLQDIDLPDLVKGLELEAAAAQGTDWIDDNLVEPVVDWLTDANLLAKLLGRGRLLELARECRQQDAVAFGAPKGLPEFDNDDLSELLEDASEFWDRKGGYPKVHQKYGPLDSPTRIPDEDVKWAIAAMLLDPDLYPGDKLVKEIEVEIPRSPGYETRYKILKGLRSEMKESLSSLVGVDIPVRASRRLPTRDEVYTGANTDVGGIVSTLLDAIKSRANPE